MSDYYQMIARCVADLQDSAVVRHEFYWLARAELEVQLSILNPPPPKSEIICERLALNDAISKVEAERSPFVDSQPFPTPQQPIGMPSRERKLECSEIRLYPDMRPFMQGRQQQLTEVSPLESSRASIIRLATKLVAVLLVIAFGFTLYQQADQFIAQLFRSTETQARQAVKSSPILTYYVGQLGGLISTTNRENGPRP
jgi:hypothetical protein